MGRRGEGHEPVAQAPVATGTRLIPLPGHPWIRPGTHRPSSAPSLGATTLSAAVLSIVLMGDALIYVVLPVSAEAFGISIVWVGVLLSTNRFVRIVSYGAIAQATTAFGLRLATIVACIGGASSTVMYWLFDGGWLLLVARLLWGLSFAGLTLTTLAYAVADRRRAGTRVGLSRANPAVRFPVRPDRGGVESPVSSGRRPRSSFSVSPPSLRCRSRSPSRANEPSRARAAPGGFPSHSRSTGCSLPSGSRSMGSSR